MEIPRHGRQGADAGNFVAAEEVGRLRERLRELERSDRKKRSVRLPGVLVRSA